jgi:hypothetical protein
MGVIAAEPWAVPPADAGTRTPPPSSWPTIGFLGGGTPSSHGPLLATFVQRLRELELRWGEADGDVAVHVIIMLEAFGMPLPGESLLIFSAALAGRGEMSLPAPGGSNRALIRLVIQLFRATSW